MCVQPLVSHIAREQQDLTGDKADEPDSELIARLARELHCYVPEELAPGWAELRAAGRDRAAQIARSTAAKQLIRDQLGLVAPGLPGACSEPLESATWLACAGWCSTAPAAAGLAGTRAGGYEAFAGAVTARLGGWGGKRLGRDRGEGLRPAGRACRRAGHGPRGPPPPGRRAGGPAVRPQPAASGSRRR